MAQSGATMAAQQFSASAIGGASGSATSSGNAAVIDIDVNPVYVFEERDRNEAEGCRRR
jgi:hypothetical protein